MSLTKKKDFTFLVNENWLVEISWFDQWDLETRRNNQKYSSKTSDPCF